MLYIALAEAAIIALLAVGLFVRERDHDSTLSGMEGTHFIERSELLTRIQHPEYVQVQPAALPTSSEPQQTDIAEFERVGKIMFDAEDQQA